MDITEYSPMFNLLKTSVEQKPTEFSWDTALRQRLARVSDIGEQQNAYAQSMSLKRMQDQLNSQYSSALSNAQNARSSAPAGGAPQGNSQPYSGDYAQSKNPRNAQQALEYAKQAAASGDSQWYRRCLAFVAQAYGLAGSGTNYAIDAYYQAPNRQTGYNAPAGALMFWKTGGRAGHVAIYAGNGMVYSTDISGKGKIGYVPVSDIANKWGAQYVGWTMPQFAANGFR